MKYEDIISLFLRYNPEPTDEQVHQLAYALNVDHQELEAVVYSMLGRELHGSLLIAPEELINTIREQLVPVEETRDATKHDGAPVLRKFARTMWVENVKPNPSAKELPEGLFTKGPSEIAEGLMRNSEDYKQAVSRLNFYRNRAGKNLDATEKNKLDQAMSLLQQRYGDKE